jgi:large subunit ribosomal protein L6
MSRIAKYPVPVPKGVEVNLAGGSIAVKGPLGAIARPADPNVGVEKEGENIVFKALGNSNHANAMSGTMRALVAGMVAGVTKGFGYSHPVVHQMPKGIKVATPTQTEIVISGVDKQLVGQVAAEVRAYRPPEPYKGKGVRYRDEVIVLKETKKK